MPINRLLRPPGTIDRHDLRIYLGGETATLVLKLETEDYDNSCSSNHDYQINPCKKSTPFQSNNRNSSRIGCFYRGRRQLGLLCRGDRVFRDATVALAHYHVGYLRHCYLITSQQIHKTSHCYPREMLSIIFFPMKVSPYLNRKWSTIRLFAGACRPLP